MQLSHTRTQFMKLDHIIHQPDLTLLEAKARIEHPEDMILDQGVKGGQTALRILKITADQPHQVSVKWDGSPSLIMGWRGDEFILTDKAGFSAKSYDGMTTSAQAIEAMIMMRKIRDASESAVQARHTYARTIAGLYDRLKQVVPRSFSGFAQGDLMYTQTPPVVAGAYEFAPVKVKYRVPVDSELGKQIGASDVGMVIHSVYDDPQDDEPRSLRDVHELGFKNTAGVCILPHEMQIAHTLSLDDHAYAVAQKLLSAKGGLISEFLNPVQLADAQIKALPSIMKSFVSHKAAKGDDDFSQAASEFLTYVTSPDSKVSAKMAPRIISHIQQHLTAYNAIWQFVGLVVGIKMDLKSQIDAQVGHTVAASLRGQPGHEGFVSVTPEGIIKLVNRAEFMRKDLTESRNSVPGTSSRVVFSFMRANPPTTGHVKVLDQIARHAQGDDYWIFLSQSQDVKKNPLSWADKAHYLGKLAPEHKGHMAVGAEFEKIKTPLLALDWLYDQGYTDVTMVVGSDRVASMTDLLMAWNSEPILSKFNREPIRIQVQSAGERDPDSDDVSGMSATKMRTWAQSGDQAQFVAHSGLPEADAHEMYEKVRQGLKVKTPVKEMWGLGKPDLKVDPTNPPRTQDYHKLALWVQDVIAQAQSKGGDATRLLSLRNPQGVWAPLMMRLGADKLENIRQILRQDPEMARMLDKAPFVESVNLKEQQAGSGTIIKLKPTAQTARKLAKWCTENKIPCVAPHKLHMTIIFSPDHLPDMTKLNHMQIRLTAHPVSWRLLGDQTLALITQSPQADQLHDKLRSMGATHEYDNFISHVSVNYAWNPRKLLPSQVPDFTLQFEQIQVEPIDNNWKARS